MRPVNLIPVEDRRGERGPMRSGPVVYVVVGALVAALAGISALVLTSNEIADSKAQIVRLQQEDATVKARARRSAAYAQFRSVREQRVATVTSLADSRFDWERVLRELSRVLPSDVWLTGLTGTVSPNVTVGASGGGSGGGGSSSASSGAGLRSSVPGPALLITGCAKGQDGVAGFVTALKEIDGVTRVGVQSSALPDANSGAGVSAGGGSGSGAGAGGGQTDCRTRPFIAQFSIVVAFDAAPVASTSAPATPAPTTSSSASPSSTSASPSSSASSSSPSSSATPGASGSSSTGSGSPSAGTPASTTTKAGG